MADPQQTPSQFSNITPIEGGGAPAQQAAPAPPSGGQFTNIQPLDGASDAAATTPPASNPSDVSGQPQDARAGFGYGVLKGAGDTVSGVAHLINKIPGIGETLAPKAGIGALDQMDKSNTPAESVGKGAETVGEYMAGDELLKFGLTGLAKATKLVELADKSPLIAKTLELAKTHPVIAKILTEGAKGGVVGGAQGAVKGAQEGNAVGGAEAGAAGGAAGGAGGTAIGETMGAAARWAGEKLGLIPNVMKDASVGLKPRKGNLNAVQDFLRIGPKLDELNQANGDTAATHEDWANLAKEARENVYQNIVEPLLAKYGQEPLSGIAIRNRISDDIPKTLKELEPEVAAKIEQFANQFMPGHTFSLNAADAEEKIQHFNAKLTATGFWKLGPSEREALLKTNPDIISYKAAGDAIRDELYGKLGDWQLRDHVPNPVDMAAAKLDYGAARNVENELRGQINVQNRQSKIGLKDVIGLAAGIAKGGPAGAAIAALPVADKIFNSPAASFGRAVKAVGRPGEGAAARLVQGATGATNAMENNAANAGAQLGRIFFTASDGSTHSIPDNENALAHAKSIDPNLQVHPAPQQ